VRKALNKRQRKKIKKEEKMKKNIMILILMSLLISLSAQQNVKEITLDEAVKMIIPDQKIFKKIESKGKIVDFNYAKKSGEIVLVEEINN